MCYARDARPPLPPISGGAGVVSKGPVVLGTPDGNRFTAFRALTDVPEAPGVAILPDVRGLHPFYEDLALRFAEAGVHATALDYFGRTAGLGPRGDDFDHRPHREQTRPETVALDVAATVRFLRSAEGGAAERVFTVGFCFGGRSSFLQAAGGLGLDGVIGFYGWPEPADPDDPNAPTLLADRFTCPVLGLFGGADRGIPREAVERFRRALEEAGVPNEIVVYEGAPHSFFDRSFEEHREASEDAWRRVLAFVGARSAEDRT
jgi:carboxymethylenebutenolidase